MNIPHHIPPLHWWRPQTDFEKLSVAQAREHYDWFISAREHRVASLLQALGESRNGYELSSVSAKVSGFVSKLGPLTRSGPSEYAQSVGTDAMLIVAERFIQEYPSILFWDLCRTGPKRNVNRFQPTLRGFKDGLEFGPIEMGAVYVSWVLSAPRESATRERRLIETFDKWQELIVGISPG